MLRGIGVWRRELLFCLLRVTCPASQESFVVAPAPALLCLADFFSLRGDSQFIPSAMLGNDVRFSSLRRRARLKEEKRTEKKFSAPAYFYATHRVVWG